jgi:hypothetical protein
MTFRDYLQARYDRVRWLALPTLMVAVAAVMLPIGLLIDKVLLGVLFALVGGLWSYMGTVRCPSCRRRVGIAGLNAVRRRARPPMRTAERPRDPEAKCPHCKISFDAPMPGSAP